MSNERIILLVEDNPDDVELTKVSLARNNVANKMVVAEDGEKALDYLLGTGKYAGQNHPLPTLVLLDLNLPKIEGLEVLQRIRSDERTKLLPVVILTSSKEQQDLIESYTLGANSYIRKPVDFDKFVSAIGTLNLYWLVLNEPPPLPP